MLRYVWVDGACRNRRLFEQTEVKRCDRERGGVKITETRPAAEKKARYEEIKEYVREKFGRKVSRLYTAQG